MYQYNITTKIVNGLKRRLSRLFKQHPSSYPYISGDGFRSIANHIFDMDSKINPEKVQKGDIVFVQSPLIKQFFTDVHPNIINPYVLITHNGDENIDGEYMNFIDDKVIHWFAQNCDIKHERVIPIPIGIENKWYYLHGIPSYFEKIKLQNVVKQNKILYKFNVDTNKSERSIALKVLENNSSSETYSDWRKSYSYLSTLQNFTFLASPPGNGIDCHRTWEAMYLKTTPIVKRSILTEYFQSIGMPLVIVDDWNELDTVDEEYLKKKYKDLEDSFDSNVLHMDYWINKIVEKRSSILNSK